ncbi:MAG: hypothetical protein AB8G26_12375 [Ilumatobacter sp.]
MNVSPAAATTHADSDRPNPDPDAHRRPDSARSNGWSPPSRARFALIIPLQLFLAAGWARAGVEKIIDPRWWSGDDLRDYLVEQRPLMLPWFRTFADVFVEPVAFGIAWFVLFAQLAIAACLATNRHVKPAVWCAIVLNVAFTMAGSVNPSAFYLVMQLALLVALSRTVSTTIALRRAALWTVPAVLLLPFAMTLHPAHVIDDPALVLSFSAMIAAVTTVAISAEAPQLLAVARQRVDDAIGRFGIAS